MHPRALRVMFGTPVWVLFTLVHDQVQNADINEYILKLNGTLKLKGVCFGIRNKHLVLSSIRPAQGLDPEELEWIITSIAVIADEYDDFLIEKFNMQQTVSASQN